MGKISIRHIGPIKDVTINLNKVNILIGPQSNGKSTIAKLVSFCLWIEKDIIVKQSQSHINAEFMRERLIIFHNMESYFNADSYIHFIGNFIDFEFHNIDNFSLSIISDLNRGVMGKIAYIPSERNILSIPNISTLPLENNYVRGFIFDWLSVRSKFDTTHPQSILDLDVNYYFDETRGDVLVLDNNREITFSQASSGLQAIVPLLIYVYYVTSWIYKNVSDISFDKYTALQRTFLKAIVGDRDDETLILALKNDSFRKQVNELLKNFSQLEKHENYSSVSDLMERISKPHYSQLIIEEPELNLFPQTQYELVKTLVSWLDLSRGDSLLITTHSPYVVTSINNLIQLGHALENGMQAEKTKGIIPPECKLDYADVSAWVVSDGYVKSINDDEFQLISSESLDSASEIISSDFNQLLGNAEL